MKFIFQETEGLDELSKGFGLRPQSLGRAVMLFGNCRPEVTISKLEETVQLFGAKPRFTNAAKALTAFVLRYNRPIVLIKGDFQSKLKYNAATCMEIIEDMSGINRYLIEGMMASAEKNTSAVKEALVELFRLKHQHFRIEETLGRAFCSMAIGEIQNIEDLASALNFDTDVAELLVQLAAGGDLYY